MITDSIGYVAAWKNRIFLLCVVLSIQAGCCESIVAIRYEKAVFGCSPRQCRLAKADIATPQGG